MLEGQQQHEGVLVRDASVSRDEDGKTRNLELRSIPDQVFQNLKLKLAGDEM